MAEWQTLTMHCNVTLDPDPAYQVKGLEGIANAIYCEADRLNRERAKLVAERDQLKADLAKAQELNKSLADRVAAQADILSRRAEAAAIKSDAFKDYVAGFTITAAAHNLIKPGDVVRHKGSDCCHYTVESVEGNDAHIVWHSPWGPRRYNVPLSKLVKVEPAKP